jgi:2-methylfumaryl-CoA hydratase
VRWVMVHKNNLDTPAPEAVIPELPLYVAPENLSLPANISAKKFDQKITGGNYFWEDYQTGERINHATGLTINDSDHSLATHLYQNNARLHFDDLMMKNSNYGKRLVYGGVAISMCRALSFDGLENAISILAINAGTHANPSFAGDTIYCITEVLDKWQLPNSDFGALRLRMVGIKNMPPAELTEIKTDKGYHPNVVLDLDYTILIPRKGQH